MRHRGCDIQLIAPPHVVVIYIDHWLANGNAPSTCLHHPFSFSSPGEHRPGVLVAPFPTTAPIHVWRTLADTGWFCFTARVKYGGVSMVGGGGVRIGCD